jgi:pyruvate dehydrogenase E1 component
LKQDFDVSADVWSVTSYAELRRDGAAIERQNMFAPGKNPAVPYVAQCLGDEIPVVAASDYVKAYADLVRPYLTQTYVTLGTDGYGRSDTRERLRHFFEVNRYYIVVAALHALAQDGKVPATQVAAAMKKYGLDPKKPDPVTI